MDYPMFMYNQGRLNEETIYKEVDAYMSYLVDVEGYTYSQIRVAGFSIGTGVAYYAAEKYPVATLILFAPYHKFSAAVNNVTPVFYGPLELYVRFQFNSYDRAPNMNCKTTNLYSLSDKVIPNSSTKELIPRFKDSEVITYNGYTHSQVFFNPTTYIYLLH
jgi:dienelactone hydrolase